MKNFAITKFTDLNAEILDSLFELESKVFDRPLSKEIISNEVACHTGVIGLVASKDQIPCGYKVGFQHSPEIFYSWIGGVHPDFRGQGVATFLMQEQHRILKETGYSYVRTHTKNKYRDMLILNIKSGFQVTGTYKKLCEVELGIILEKKL